MEEERIEFNDALMSLGFVTVPRVILRSPVLTLQAKAVFIMLLDYAWNKAQCFPGRDRLATDAGVHVNSIDKHIKELTNIGLLHIERRGKKRTNVYKIMISGDVKWLDVLKPTGYDPGEKQEHESPDDDAPGSGGNGKSRAKKNTETEELITRVINYMNKRLGSNYSTKTKETRRLIGIRIKEEEAGPDDFKDVIDFLYFKWKDDPEMSPYLRPHTMFNGKMQGYLREARINKQKLERKNVDDKPKNSFLDDYYRNGE